MANLKIPAVIMVQQLDTPQLATIGECMSVAVQRLGDVPLSPLLDLLLAASEITPTGPLVDELSVHVCPSNYRDRAKVKEKACAEAASVNLAATLVGRFADGHCDFATLLTGISAIAFGPPQRFRQCPAGIVRDSHGLQVMFPSPAQSMVLLGDLERQLLSRMSESYALSALLAMVGLIHSHPFADGNGRIARILFAAVVRWGSRCAADIPVLALQCVSYPSFLVRTRRAQCSGDWAPIAGHMLATLDLLADFNAMVARAGRN